MKEIFFLLQGFATHAVIIIQDLMLLDANTLVAY